jgi:GNAT superfamily N-acetyltransferase
LIYREAKIWDAERIAEMWAETVREAPMMVMDESEFEKLFISVITSIKKDDNFVAVCEIEGEIKGFIAAHLRAMTWGYPDWIGHCDCLHIAKELRGKGHADFLIEIFKAWAEDSGAKRITFETKYSDRLSKIWERRGYTPMTIFYGQEVTNG